MPYITQDRRELFDQYLLPEPQNAGELNYVLTSIIHDYWLNNGRNYQAFNDIMGAMEGAKLELYRRKIAPYEDGKIAENGDIE